MTRTSRFLAVAATVLVSTQMAAPASAAVSVSRAELNGSGLRIDGTASADQDIRVDGVVMARSSSSGTFRIERDPYSPPADCTVDLTDGSPTTTSVRLSGCTVSQPPPPPSGDTVAPSAPTGLVAAVTGTTVDLSWTASTDDVGVTGYRVRRDGTALSGTPTGTTFADSGLAAGTYTYTVSAFDAAGNTSAQSTGVSATVSAGGLYFITPAQMPDATLGQAYLGYIVSSDPPGPSTFRFKLVSGSVPDGTRFSGNTLENRPEARVTGTPSRTGTFSFTVQVQDNTGATARRAFTIRVVAGS